MSPSIASVKPILIIFFFFILANQVVHPERGANTEQHEAAVEQIGAGAGRQCERQDDADREAAGRRGPEEGFRPRVRLHRRAGRVSGR